MCVADVVDVPVSCLRGGRVGRFSSPDAPSDPPTTPFRSPIPAELLLTLPLPSPTPVKANEALDVPFSPRPEPPSEPPNEPPEEEASDPPDEIRPFAIPIQNVRGGVAGRGGGGGGGGGGRSFLTATPAWSLVPTPPPLLPAAAATTAVGVWPTCCSFSAAMRSLTDEN